MNSIELTSQLMYKLRNGLTVFFKITISQLTITHSSTKSFIRLTNDKRQTKILFPVPKELHFTCEVKLIRSWDTVSASGSSKRHAWSDHLQLRKVTVPFTIQKFRSIIRKTLTWDSILLFDIRHFLNVNALGWRVSAKWINNRRLYKSLKTLTKPK